MKLEDLIALGLTEEVATKVIAAHTETLKGFIPKHRFDEVNEAKKQAEESIKTYDQQLKDLKKASEGNEELKAQIDKLQAENATAKEKYEADIKKLKIDNVVDNALASAKNKKAVKALLDLSNAELDGETVKGLEDQIKKLQEAEDSKFLFNIEGTGGTKFKGAKPGEKGDGGGSGDGGGIKNPWSKEHWNLTEQGKLLRENPELAAQLKNV